MDNLIQTIPGENYSRIDPRAFEHNGCIIDLGCESWDWSAPFIGKKRVIGADPFEKTVPEGAELFKGIVGSFDGQVKMNFDNKASRIATSDSSAEWTPSLSWKSFCKQFEIDKISILKMNIEGAEFPLLHSMDIEDFEKIDQLIVSFHDWLNPAWGSLTEASFHLINSNGFTIKNIGPWGWHMALK